jgi:hypothetical protein
MSYENFRDHQPTPDGLVKKLWAFDWKEPVGSELGALNCFTDCNQSGVVLA